MRREIQTGLIERMLASLAADGVPAAPEARVPVANYRDSARLARENAVLFRRFPLLVAHQSELAGPGDCLTHDASGVPLLLVRDPGGEVRAFLNVCRHRGARLVSGPCERPKAFTCPYHAWSYSLAGELLHIPLEGAFQSVDRERSSLIELPVSLRRGFVWVLPQRGAALDIDDFLGEVGDDLEHFGVPSYHVFRKDSAVRDTHWKLVIDAFLEGYHVKSLHRDSLYRFFLDRGVIFDTFTRHVRSSGPRRAIREAAKLPREEWDIRRFATVFYFLFPNSVLVFHPDSLSHITLFPEGDGRARYIHTFLVPEAPKDDKAREHWERTYDLIDKAVFQREDIAIAESIQRGLGAEDNDTFVLGSLEYPIRFFHDAIDRALAE